MTPRSRGSGAPSRRRGFQVSVRSVTRTGSPVAASVAARSGGRSTSYSRKPPVDPHRCRAPAVVQQDLRRPPGRRRWPAAVAHPERQRAIAAGVNANRRSRTTAAESSGTSARRLVSLAWKRRTCRSSLMPTSSLTRRPAHACRLSKFVEAVVELLVADGPRGYASHGDSHRGRRSARSSIGVTLQRDDSRSVPPPPTNSTRS